MAACRYGPVNRPHLSAATAGDVDDHDGCGILELVGGLLIFLGFLTRPVAFILCGMMAVAYWGFHVPMNPWPANNLGVAAILYCFIFFYLFFAGPARGASTRSAAASRAVEHPIDFNDMAARSSSA